MPYTPEAIANYFIELPDATDLTPMKLQKLVYFAHGWHLALTDEPLLDEPISAWEYGPVVERLYHALKQHGDSSIHERLRRLKMMPPNDSENRLEEYIPSLDDEPSARAFTKKLLTRIWEIYGRYNAIQLSKMTHQEGTPWYEIRNQFPTLLPKGVPIPNEAIRTYFASKLPAKVAG
ncbi:MAG: SocA family protein [Planctomycetales bacterium]|nr:SocA family protein [Planctomycetales bacterium]